MPGLTEAELLEVLSGGESERVGFKRDFTVKDEVIAREVAAFANSQGGRILFGASDDGVVCGCALSNARRAQLENALLSIKPVPTYTLWPACVGAVTVWVLEVSKRNVGPCFLSGAIYVRQGAMTRKVIEPSEISRMMYDVNVLSFDKSPVPGDEADWQRDASAIAEFVQAAHITAGIGEEQLMRNLNLMCGDGRLRRAALLFFGAEPERYVFSAQVHCAVFKGRNKFMMLEDKMFGGPLLRQLHDTMSWLRKHLPVAYHFNGALRHEEEWAIPLKALHEALVNALVHRDYNKGGATVCVELYDDRVVVTNPGGLLPEVERNFGYLSMSRNELMLSLMMRCQEMERIGSGIMRMREHMRLAGLPAPEFKSSDFFEVTFRRGDECDGNGAVRHRGEQAEEEKAVLDKLRLDDQETPQGLSRRLGIPLERIEKHIALLRELGLLVWLGDKWYAV